MANIPIANIYYMLCYAWNEFAPREIQTCAVEEFPDTLHLFSRQLIVGLNSLHRRGFEKGYIPLEEHTSTPRGRILIASSIRTMANRPRKLWCAIDEMSADVQSNQIIKATLKQLIGVKELGASLRKELRQTRTLLRDVNDIELSQRAFHSVRLHENNRLYSYLLAICRFLYESLEAQDRPGQYTFKEVDRDEVRMRRVFEKFVRHFFEPVRKLLELRVIGWIGSLSLRKAQT
jgi:5-methylcytosine-specific restriction enzyme subunit McrC